MVRTSMLAAAAGSPRTAPGAMRPGSGAAMIPGLSRSGSPGFSQILTEALMTRQDRPQAVSGRRQEFPRPLRNLGDAHLASMLTRTSLGRGIGRVRNLSTASAGGGSDVERLFNAGRARGGRAVDPQAFEGLIKNAAARHQVPEELVKAVIKVESNFNPQATSHMGAMGLMQLMPGTARDMGVRRPYDPRDNIEGGTKYLRELLDRYDGNVPMAVAAYNCGMANVEKGRLPQETRNYLQLVSRHYGGQKILTKPKVTTPPPVPKAAPRDLPTPDLSRPEVTVTST